MNLEFCLNLYCNKVPQCFFSCLEIHNTKDIQAKYTKYQFVILQVINCEEYQIFEQTTQLDHTIDKNKQKLGRTNVEDNQKYSFDNTNCPERNSVNIYGQLHSSIASSFKIIINNKYKQIRKRDRISIHVCSFSSFFKVLISNSL